VRLWDDVSWVYAGYACYYLLRKSSNGTCSVWDLCCWRDICDYSENYEKEKSSAGRFYTPASQAWKDRIFS